MIQYMPDVLKAMDNAIASHPDLQEVTIEGFITLVNPVNEELMARYEHTGHILLEMKVFNDRLFAIFVAI